VLNPIIDEIGQEPPAAVFAAGPRASHSQDSGLRCLLLMARLHDIAAEESALRHEFGEERFDTPRILLAAKRLGLSAKLITPDPLRLDRVALPAIAIDREGHYFIVAKLNVSATDGVRLLVQRPDASPTVLPLKEFLSLSSGRLLLFASRTTYAQEMARFDFSWFIPSVIKYRRLFGEVLLISLALQLIALVTPIFFQIVMDKVLVNHAVATLDVIAIALLVAIFFEALLTWTRSFVFAHTTSKMDVELGTRLFRHLIDLPVTYFHARRVGDSVARVRELESIRGFLTGNALTVVLDLVFSIVFIAVMFVYSTKLTLLVLASIPVYVVLSLVFTPALRARLDEKFNRGAENQAFLVETISGIDTIKSMAIEPRWHSRWEKTLAAYVRASLGATNLGFVASGLITLVGKLVSLGIVWIGAWEVMDGRLSVGELVAFNMLSGQVATPVMRLAQLWNDFQQVGISMQRLGDILNARTELLGRRSLLPRIAGGIEFEQVSFRYRPDGAPALKNVSFRVAPGEVVGIVGRSGSGKSTLTKLIQRLYVPESGRVLVDQFDLATIDPPSLRHQIGVVPQEGTLFHRSVRDNIALTHPSASLEEVIEAARLAGAHQFICELAEGYDTIIGEHGVGLSGGQRQRIAIARALIHNPRLLILDEATSALDYESESIIQASMTRICRGRTVLIVAHRLSAVRHADRILVMERGQVEESGAHDELVHRPGGIYAQLHRLQCEALRE
jgi:subfamily B ATP-binding cassette protein HlyB/CyaB